MERPQTPTDQPPQEGAADLELVMGSFDNAWSRERLLERMRCVPRILAAKNALMGRPLNAADLEDLAQETIVLVWSKRTEFQGRGSIESWVYPFCYHTLMNRVRARRTGPRIVGEARETDSVLVEGPDYSELHAALQALEPEDEALIRMKHYEDLSFTEIGDRLRIPSSTVKSRYYKALMRLRSLVPEEAFPG